MEMPALRCKPMRDVNGIGHLGTVVRNAAFIKAVLEFKGRLIKLSGAKAE